MLKHLEIKKRHHYVWANYLARWGNGTKNVFYTTKTGKTAHDSVRAIAVEDYFYKTTKLTRKDVEVIKGLSRQSPDYLHQLHMAYLDDFLKFQELETLYFNSSIQNKEIEQHLHASKCNLLENLHSSHERSVLTTLESLANEKLDVIENQQALLEFLSFFGQQISRTKSFRDNAIKNLSRCNADEIELADSITHAWWFLSYMYGINLGASLFTDRHTSRHSLLINNTKVPFITSDHPIINVHPSVSEKNCTAPQYADFYYPITPRIAYLICDSKRFKPGKNKIDITIAIELNTKMASQAMKHIIGDSLHAIQFFKKHIGRSY